MHAQHCRLQLAMASGMVRCSISSAVEDKELQLDSSRLSSLRQLGSTILKRITEEEKTMTVFDEFSNELISTLTSIFTPQKTYRSSESKRTKYWSDFHQQRAMKLPKLWNEFLSAVHIEANDHAASSAICESEVI